MSRTQRLQLPVVRLALLLALLLPTALLALASPAFGDDVRTTELAPVAHGSDVEPIASVDESDEVILFASAEELIESMALVPAPSQSSGLCLSCQTHADCDSLCGVRGYAGGVCFRDGGECYPNEKSCTCF